MTALCNCGKPATHRGMCRAKWAAFHKRRHAVPDKKGWRSGNPGWNATVYHDPDDLCGGRRLQGSEFDRRKAELEARDLAARTKAQGVTA